MRSLWTIVGFAAVLLAAGADADAQPQKRRPQRPARPRQPPVLAVPRPAERTRARRLGLGTANAAESLLHARPNASWVVAARGRPTQRYLWPVLNGIATQGFAAQGGNHQALDIGAPCGTVIRAAHGGLVGYSASHGNGGNTVAIVHAGGWVTAYAHARRTLVAAGALVRRGQPIAEVGDTGDAHGCHVHFVVARNGTRLDPERHVAGRPGPARRSRPSVVASRR